MTKAQLQLLKEFCNINTSFSITSTEDIGVLSPDKSAILFYTPRADEFTEFNTKTRIYSVDYLVNLIDTIGADSIVTVVQDSHVQIKNGNRQVKFLQANATTVPDAPASVENKFQELEIDIEFTLNKFDLEQIKKISSLLGLTEVKIIASKKKVSVILGSTDVKSSNNFSIELEGKGNTEIYFDITNLTKLMVDDYKVQISSAGLSKFSSVNVEGLRYYLTSLAK